MASFKQWLETQETIPIGDCFRFATQLGTSMLADGIIPDNDIKVVHAIVHPKWHHRPYPHAWVEARGRAHDWQMKQTRVGSIPIQDFYQEYNPTDIKKYTPARAVGMMVKSGHHGPWEEFVENHQPETPSLRWVIGQLRNNVTAHISHKVLAAYIVGSQAKGTARPDSDLDIAVIIPPIRGKSAMQFTNIYHSKFTNELWKPKWNGRVIDFQFFYPNDPELATYSKIPLM